jgi:general secretion pathway protein L
MFERHNFLNNQHVTAKMDASERSILALNNAAEIKMPCDPCDAMLARAAQFGAKAPKGPLKLIAAEHVGSHVVSVPKSTARQRHSMITFAVEDRIAAPIETVKVVEGPTQGGGQVLAFVVENDLFAQFDAVSTPLLPEFLMIPRPDGLTGPAWFVWKERNRVVVRCSNGTGFAVSPDMLPCVWKQAGKPTLISLGDPLGDELRAQDMSANPPDPDAFDLAFSFARMRRLGAGGIGYWRLAMATIAVAIVIQLGIAALNVISLRRVADLERSNAQTAIAAPLPGVSLSVDVTPILARLQPAPSARSQGSFLPLLNDVAEVLSADGMSISFRRLAWGEQENALIVLVQSAGLSDLQRLQQTLETKGFVVRSGAANAGDGGAEVEMRISRSSAE